MQSESNCKYRHIILDFKILNKEKKHLRLGLVGRRLSHSFSKKYFEEEYHEPYTLIELDDLTELTEVIEDLGLDGFNVTIPFKRDIVPMLDGIDPAAREIGAVNTVVVRKGNDEGKPKMYGYNTDAPAFLDTLRPHLIERHRRALVLGSGGASCAVAWALRQLGIEYRVVSRSAEANPRCISYNEARALVMNGGYTIIINTTPAGMYPQCDESPWQWPELIDSHHLCYDLIYNPSPTLFLQKASKRGAKTVDGLAMLHRQADLAYKIWTSATQ